MVTLLRITFICILVIRITYLLLTHEGQRNLVFHAIETCHLRESSQQEK